MESDPCWCDAPPTDAWTAQQLREATAYGKTPKYLIRDHGSKFGPCFARVVSRE